LIADIAGERFEKPPTHALRIRRVSTHFEFMLIVLRQRRRPLLRFAVSHVGASIECVSGVARRRSAVA
jgi:hypothetical protein